MTGQVIEEGDLPVQAGRIATGPPGDQPSLPEAYLEHRGPVPAAERGDHRYLAPSGQYLAHDPILLCRPRERDGACLDRARVVEWCR